MNLKVITLESLNNELLITFKDEYGNLHFKHTSPDVDVRCGDTIEVNMIGNLVADTTHLIQLVRPVTVLKLREVREQIQEDIRTFLDDYDEEISDEVCEIVVRNMKELG